MFRSHLRRLQLASVSLMCFLMVSLGGNKAKAQESSKKAELTVAPVQLVPAVPVAPSNVLSNIPTAEAKAHIGETNTVCGLVTGGRFLESAKGKPTFLNFERPFPEHTFTVVIFESDRAKFQNPPESWFDGKTVCVTGPIIDYKGKPEIIVHDPSQMVLQEATPTTSTASETTSNSSQKLPTSVDHR